jgi:probable F420-dependent oxidoreductase
MTAQWRDQIGRFGVWRPAAQTTPDIAVGLEALGYGAVWLGGSPSGDLAIVDRLLGAARNLTVGTSVVNMWQDDAATVAQSFARIEARFPHRFILGVGAGHPEATAEYASPYQTLTTYVSQLLEAGVPQESVVLAALGPKVLSLARERTGGAIPYLVTPVHAKLAREILGPDRLLAPEQKVVLSTDLAEARSLARRRVDLYLGLVNYTANLRRLGFTDDDLADGGSDALVDALVAHGSSDQVAAQLFAHLDAGADHVCVQMLTGSDTDPMPAYAELAGALGL